MNSFSMEQTSNNPPFTTLKSEAGIMIRNDPTRVLYIKKNKELTRVHSAQISVITNVHPPLLQNKINYKKRLSFQKYPK